MAAIWRGLYISTVVSTQRCVSGTYLWQHRVNPSEVAEPTNNVWHKWRGFNWRGYERSLFSQHSVNTRWSLGTSKSLHCTSGNQILRELCCSAFLRHNHRCTSYETCLCCCCAWSALKLCEFEIITETEKSNNIVCFALLQVFFAQSACWRREFIIL